MKALFRTLVLLLLPFVSSAQENEGSRTMRVVAFGNAADSLFYQNGPEKVEIVLTPGTLSYDLPMPKDPALKLYRMVPPPAGAPADAKPVPLSAGTVELVEGARKAIVLLIVPPDLSKESVRGRAFKDSYALHPAETVRVFNLSPKEVAVRAGGEAKPFAIGETGVMPWKGGKEGAVAYQVATRQKGEDKWLVVDSGERASRPDLRVFAFVCEIMVEGKPTVAAQMAFDDVPEATGE